MAQQARDYVKGIFPPAYDSAGGLDEGDTTQFTTPASDGSPQVIKPSGTAPWLQTFYGIMTGRGPVGGTGSAAGEGIAPKRQGLGRIKVAVNQAITRGAQLINDATTLGAVKARAAYSFSAQVIAHAEEAISSSSAVQMVEAYIQPYFVEVVRCISAFSPTTFPAATRYLGAAGVALSSAQVPVYRARFTGEVIRNLSTNLLTAPGGSDTIITTLQKSSDNGGTWSDLTLTTTISAAGKTATDLVHTDVLAAGDLVCIKAVSTGITAAGLSATFDVT